MRTSLLPTAIHPRLSLQEQQKQLKLVLEQLQLSRQHYQKSQQQLQSCEEQNEQLELRMRNTRRQHEDVVSKTAVIRKRYLEIHQQLGTAAQLQQHLLHDRQIIVKLQAHNLELQQQLDRALEQQSRNHLPRDGLGLLSDSLVSSNQKSRLRLPSPPKDHARLTDASTPSSHYPEQTPLTTRPHSKVSERHIPRDERDEQVLDHVVGDMENLSRRLSSRLQQLTAREWPLLSQKDGEQPGISDSASRRKNQHRKNARQRNEKGNYYKLG